MRPTIYHLNNGSNCDNNYGDYCDNYGDYGDNYGDYGYDDNKYHTYPHLIWPNYNSQKYDKESSHIIL